VRRPALDLDPFLPAPRVTLRKIALPVLAAAALFLPFAQTAHASTAKAEQVTTVPHGTYRVQLPNLPSPTSGSNASRLPHMTAPPLQEVYVFQDSLDGRPLDDEGGWTHFDNSAGPTAWHIDTFHACNGHAWWCGRVDSTWIYDTNRAGYDNSWTQYLQNSVNTFGVTTGTPVTMTVHYYMNVEPNFDYGEVQYDDLDDLWLPLIDLTGVHPTNGVGCDSFTVVLPESSWTKWNNYPTGHKPMPFRFVFNSDIEYSSADGLYNGDGWVIDEVRIQAGSQMLFYDNVENGPGAWSMTTLPAVGDYYNIQSNVTTEDQCTQDRTNLWVM